MTVERISGKMTGEASNEFLFVSTVKYHLRVVIQTLAYLISFLYSFLNFVESQRDVVREL